MPRISVERNISFDSRRRVYYICLDAGRTADGKRDRRYRTAPTLRAARSILLEFQIQRRRGLHVPPSELTLEAWMELWYREVILPTRAATTAYGYRKIMLNHLFPALGRLPLQQLTPGDIQHYYAGLLRDKALSSNTIRRHHDLLSAALHAAVRQGLLARCPTDRAEPPRLLPTRTSFYGAEDLRRLFELVENTPLEVPVRLAGTLGLRREEVCGLKWENIDLDRRLLHVCLVRTCAGGQVIEKEPKNPSSLRVLHLDQGLCRLLQNEYRRQTAERRRLGPLWSESGFVVVDEHGLPPTPDSLTRRFTAFVRRNGLPHLTLHGLRHSFATVANQQGVPLFEIGKALGHSTPATTGKIYTHLTDYAHASALDRVARAVR